MLNKNINLTNTKNTIIPIYYIDTYKSNYIKEVFNEYKFKSKFNNKYLLNILIDLCIYIIIDDNKKKILFTNPPSTMFYRKEKNIDSMGNLINNVKKSINQFFKNEKSEYLFKQIFSINKKYLKNKKAQHIDGNRANRISKLNKRYYINFWNKRYLKNIDIVIIIDDISSTGGTLYACKETLKDYGFEIQLYSLAH